MGNSELDWEHLPELCLFMVLDKLDVPGNLVLFGAVSRYWHSVFNTFLDIKRRSSLNPVPMLLIPTKKSETKRKLYSLQAKAKVSNIELGKPCTKRFCGSCYGWLATVNKKKVITLSNPFKNGISIDLPRLKYSDRDRMDYQYKIRKVVLSADPLLHPNSYIVMVIYSSYSRLAFYKSWQKDWIYIDNLSYVRDVIFYRSLVYVIGSWNEIVSFDVINGIINDKSSKSLMLKTLIPENGRVEAYSDRAYLVESSKGNLYSIHKHLDVEEGNASAHFTQKFRVCKLVLDDENGAFLEKEDVKSMDGDVVFVGDNRTIAVSALDFPEGQPNSIYFTDDYFDIIPYEPYGPRDIGIFNLKDGSFVQHYQFKPSHKNLPPYIWVLPPVEFKPVLSS